MSGHGESEEQSSEVERRRRRRRRRFFPFSSPWCYFGCFWYFSRTPLLFLFFLFWEMITELRLFRKILVARCALTLCFSRRSAETRNRRAPRKPHRWNPGTRALRKFDISRKPANLLFLGFLLHAWYAYSLVFPFCFVLDFCSDVQTFHWRFSSHMSSI